MPDRWMESTTVRGFLVRERELLAEKLRSATIIIAGRELYQMKPEVRTKIWPFFVLLYVLLHLGTIQVHEHVPNCFG